jgi:hypothetical protein
METKCSSKTLVPNHQATWSHIPEDGNMNIHCYENIKPHEGSLRSFINLRPDLQMWGSWGNQNVEAPVSDDKFLL